MNESQLYEQLYLDGGGRIRPYFREDLGVIVPVQPEIQLRTDRKTKGGKALPDGIEVRFGTAKPTEEERKRLIAYGFRWSAKQKMWARSPGRHLFVFALR